MKKRIEVVLVLLLTIAAGSFVFGWSQVSAADNNGIKVATKSPIEVSKKYVPKATVEARVAQSCGSSSTYLHVACAEEIAFRHVEYHCCPVFGRYGYMRFNDERVDIDVRAYRNSTSQCRWVIVRGTDVSKYAYYHPDKNWRSCGL